MGDDVDDQRKAREWDRTMASAAALGSAENAGVKIEIVASGGLC